MIVHPRDGVGYAQLIIRRALQCCGTVSRFHPSSLEIAAVNGLRPPAFAGIVIPHGQDIARGGDTAQRNRRGRARERAQHGFGPMASPPSVDRLLNWPPMPVRVTTVSRARP